MAAEAGLNCSDRRAHGCAITMRQALRHRPLRLGGGNLVAREQRLTKGNVQVGVRRRGGSGRSAQGGDRVVVLALLEGCHGNQFEEGCIGEAVLVAVVEALQMPQGK